VQQALRGFLEGLVLRRHDPLDLQRPQDRQAVADLLALACQQGVFA
jgi:hypothetical protein